MCYNVANAYRGDFMNIEKWIKKNTSSLLGKKIAVTGSTGGLGRELCRYLASLGANLILMDRNAERSAAFASELTSAFPNISVERIGVELSDMSSVRNACEELKKRSPDLFIHNAGAYSIPRKTCDSGYDNVFQINFLSPYYIIRQLLPILKAKGGHVMVVGSIAHRYSKTDPDNIDFANIKKASLVYGNAKRYLMFSLYELFKNEKEVSLSVVHPGITFTNITAHYPKLIFAIIKYPMKIIFPSPKRAALSLLSGAFESCGYREWIGPRIFDIWGLPKKKLLKGVSQEESQAIGNTAEEIYKKVAE